MHPQNSNLIQLVKFIFSASYLVIAFITLSNVEEVQFLERNYNPIIILNVFFVFFFAILLWYETDPILHFLKLSPRVTSDRRHPILRIALLTILNIALNSFVIFYAYNSDYIILFIGPVFIAFITFISINLILPEKKDSISNQSSQRLNLVLGIVYYYAFLLGGSILCYVLANSHSINRDGFPIFIALIYTIIFFYTLYHFRKQFLNQISQEKESGNSSDLFLEDDLLSDETDEGIFCPKCQYHLNTGILRAFDNQTNIYCPYCGYKISKKEIFPPSDEEIFSEHEKIKNLINSQPNSRETFRGE